MLGGFDMSQEYKVKNNIFVLMAKNEIRTLTKLAEIAGVDYKKLYSFANNKQKYIDPDFLGAVCNALGCDIGELITLER